jgi:hypothetical protein
VVAAARASAAKTRLSAARAGIKLVLRFSPEFVWRCAVPVRISPRAALFTLALMLAGGCAGPIDPPTQPMVATSETAAGLVATQGGFFPLTIGNLWYYRNLVRVRIVPADGSAPTFSTQVFTSDREMFCSESRNGTEYRVMRNVDVGPNGTSVAWRRYRQTGAGLFQLNRDFDVPPPCARPNEPSAWPAGPGRDEALASLVDARPAGEQAAWRDALTRLDRRMTLVRAAAGLVPMGLPRVGDPLLGENTELVYPLERKARWVVSQDEPFLLTAEVEGVDELNLSAGRFSGYRIRLFSDVLGPNDWIRVWYGPAGFLQAFAHAELDAVDIGGNVIGTAFVDHRQTLREIHLRDRRGIGPRPWDPGPPPR